MTFLPLGEWISASSVRNRKLRLSSHVRTSTGESNCVWRYVHQIGEPTPIHENLNLWLADILILKKKNFFQTETFSRCTAVPESLQEAFIKRKKAFIERSSQRQKEIKDKVHASGNSQTKTITEKTTGICYQRELCIYLVVLLSGIIYFTQWLVFHSGSFVSDLKGMSKVRVSLPEDKKTAQPHTHERALGYVYGSTYIW